MSHPKAVDQHNIPGAWYDLSGRISAARAVTSCIFEALPNGVTGHQYDRLNLAANLVAALEDILKLCEQDVNLLEQPIKKSGVSA